MRLPIFLSLAGTAVTLLTIVTTTGVSAICPGFNFGIADTGPSAEDPELGTCEFLSPVQLKLSPQTV